MDDPAEAVLTHRRKNLSKQKHWTYARSMQAGQDDRPRSRTRRVLPVVRQLR